MRSFQSAFASAALLLALAAPGAVSAHGPGGQGGGMMTHPGMMGCPMMGGYGGGMGPGMIGPGMMGQGQMMGRAMSMGPRMAMMFAMMDTNGDRAISLEEMQAMHKRMFDYADEDKDGQVTLEEMRAFMQGDE